MGLSYLGLFSQPSWKPKPNNEFLAVSCPEFLGKAQPTLKADSMVLSVTQKCSLVSGELSGVSLVKRSVENYLVLLVS